MRHVIHSCPCMAWRDEISAVIDLWFACARVGSLFETMHSLHTATHSQQQTATHLVSSCPRVLVSSCPQPAGNNTKAWYRCSVCPAGTKPKRVAESTIPGYVDLPSIFHFVPGSQHVIRAIKSRLPWFVPVFRPARSPSPYFVPGSPHGSLLELRPALISYQDCHKLVPSC